TLPARARRDRIRAAVSYGKIATNNTPEGVSFRERAVGPFVTWLAGAMLRLNGRQSLDTVSRLLVSAGIRNASPQAFLAAKGAAGIGGAFLGFLIGASSSASGAFVFALIFGAIGYVLPAMIVGSRARRRKAELAAQLPDALDLLAVSVEAGLGFDAAVAKLTQ